MALIQLRKNKNKKSVTNGWWRWWRISSKRNKKVSTENDNWNYKKNVTFEISYQ